jgi:hypothetical protein
VTKKDDPLGDFIDVLEELEDELLSHEYHKDVNNKCICGRGKCKTICEDCISPQMVCDECFIEGHRHNPFHWAKQWDSDAGFFVRRDISTLRGTQGYAIPLGHNGERCPHELSELREQENRENTAPGIAFTVVHSNGIHGTRVQFCSCMSNIPRRIQLVRAKLFPATTKLPLTAFTFSALRQFRMHSLQSKCSAQDFLSSLRRLSDNVHVTDVPVSKFDQMFTCTHFLDQYPIQPFLRASRVWNYLQTRRMMGVTHGISTYFTSRTEHDLRLSCPACPEEDVNISSLEIMAIPSELRHLAQQNLTCDGNFHLNQFRKTQDPDLDNSSLWNRNGYFPKKEEFSSFLADIGDNYKTEVSLIMTTFDNLLTLML